MSNLLVEIPYSLFLGILVFVGMYYPIFGTRSSEQQELVLLYCIVFYVFASTFLHMLISWALDADTAGPIGIVFLAMSLLFNGVMQPPGEYIENIP